MDRPPLSHLFQEDLYYFSTPVVVVLPKAWESYSADEHTLLQKILTSVKVNMSAIQIVVAPSIDLRALRVFAPARVLIFGCQTDETVAFYEQTPAQGFIVMRADELGQLDDQKKKNLWVALRQMFAV